MKKEEIGILIPAFNEEETVGEVVREAKEYGTVIVLDDGSKDKTKEIAEQEGAIVFSHSENRGLGCALRTLFAIALKNEEYVKKFCKTNPISLKELPDFKTLVTLDSDGQHDPKDLPKLVNSLHGDVGFCLGVRDMSVYPAIKRIGNFGLNFLTNVFSLTRF
ncbi:TPA: glycosyltransferase family 2 protein, partial [Candidatus Bathyarchaeota archaeon]|nr:glycosyltransferase family 2 protein [Candidatus Bathyarchaeota archaeon]